MNQAARKRNRRNRRLARKRRTSVSQVRARTRRMIKKRKRSGC